MTTIVLIKGIRQSKGGLLITKQKQTATTLTRDFSMH